jgi:CDGSH-type Zn-finger protein
MDNNTNELTEIRINRNGPIKVIGTFTITGANGDKLESKNTNEVYLCACGRSKNKPFCDGSHNSVIIK